MASDASRPVVASASKLNPMINNSARYFSRDQRHAAHRKRVSFVREINGADRNLIFWLDARAIYTWTSQICKFRRVRHSTDKPRGVRQPRKKWGFFAPELVPDIDCIIPLSLSLPLCIYLWIRVIRCDFIFGRRLAKLWRARDKCARVREIIGPIVRSVCRDERFPWRKKSSAQIANSWSNDVTPRFRLIWTITFNNQNGSQIYDHVNVQTQWNRLRVFLRVFGSISI